jgi:predicted nucleic-acid-binding protein
VQALDTNVVVRLLVRDDEAQCRRAEQLYRRAIATGGVWIPSVVIVETAWVLRVAYSFDRPAISTALKRLVRAEGVIAEDEAATLRALAAFEAGPADFSDYLVLDAMEQVPLGALCWAAAGKDPGFTPAMLLDLLRRRGRYRPEDFARLHLAQPVDLPKLKLRWLAALDAAEHFFLSPTGNTSP